MKERFYDCEYIEIPPDAPIAGFFDGGIGSWYVANKEQPLPVPKVGDYVTAGFNSDGGLYNSPEDYPNRLMIVRAVVYRFEVCGSHGGHLGSDGSDTCGVAIVVSEVFHWKPEP
jgi:hypothetical protein